MYGDGIISEIYKKNKMRIAALDGDSLRRYERILAPQSALDCIVMHFDWERTVRYQLVKERLYQGNSSVK